MCIRSGRRGAGVKRDDQLGSESPPTGLQAIFKAQGKGSSYGAATTHHEKLWPKLEGGGGGGCPVLTFAITAAVYEDDGDEAVEQAKAAQAAARADARRRGAPLDDEG